MQTWTLKRIVGTAVAAISTLAAAVLAVLSAGPREDLFKRAEGWLSYFRHVASDVFTILSLQGVLVIFAIVVGFWVWDVPQLLMAKLKGEDRALLEEARRRRTRAHVGQYFRELYSGPARHAIGDSYSEAEHAIRLLRFKPDGFRVLASYLLAEAVRHLDESVQPVLNAQACSTDAQLCEYMQAWGRLFIRYQSLVRYTYEAYSALDFSVHERQLYWEWRDRDEKFIAALRDAEHMAGAQHIVSGLREAGWGEQYRPVRVSAAPDSAA